MCGISREP